MAVVLSSNRYGKSRVRLVKVERHGTRHDLKELNVEILLQGEFEDCYTTGDNACVVPTDTMKNTVYALARQESLGEIEEFGQRLATHFLTRHSHVERAQISISEGIWKRIITNGREHEHSFIGGTTEQRTTRIEQTRDGVSVRSGLTDLVILKTTKSGFEGYIHDEYTTLKETKDRIFGTSVTAEWAYRGQDISYHALWQGIRQTLLDVFSAHDSLGVQHSLYAMGELVLEQFPEVVEIRLTMPNRHCLLVDLSPFGLTNPNEVFVPTDEPHGLIEAVLTRSE
jgi:urate oxidase